MIATATFPTNKIVLGMMNQSLDLPTCFRSSLFSGTFSFVHIQRPEEITVGCVVEAEEDEETEYIRHDMVEALCICSNSQEEYMRTQYWLQNLPAWTFSPMFPIFLLGAPRKSPPLDPFSVISPNTVICLPNDSSAFDVHSLLLNAIERFRASRMCGTSYSQRNVVQQKN